MPPGGPPDEGNAKDRGAGGGDLRV
jgi:hypothetical protein